MNVVTDVSSYTKNVLRTDLSVRNKGDGRHEYLVLLRASNSSESYTKIISSILLIHNT